MGRGPIWGRSSLTPSSSLELSCFFLKFFLCLFVFFLFVFFGQNRHKMTVWRFVRTLTKSFEFPSLDVLGFCLCKRNGI